MKKLLPLLLACLFVFLTFLPVHAEEEQVLSSKQISEEELAILYNTEFYDSSLEGVSLTDQPIIKIYAFHLPSILYENSSTVSETLSALEKSTDYATMHYLIGETFVAVERTEGTTTVKKIPTDNVPFITDIKSMGTEICIDGFYNRKILDIYCFDAKAPNSDFVCLITDVGILVKCYDWLPSNYYPVIFTEEEFSEYVISYYRHCIHVYADFVDGHTSFMDYVHKYYGTSEDYGTRYQQTRTVLIVSATGAAVLVAGSVSTFFIVKKLRKKKRSAQSEN